MQPKKICLDYSTCVISKHSGIEWNLRPLASVYTCKHLKQLIWTLKCWSDGRMLGDGGAALTGCGSRPSPPPAGCVRIEARGRSEVCLLPPNSWCLQDTNQTGFYYHYHYCDIIMVIISNDWRKNKQWEHKLGYWKRSEERRGKYCIYGLWCCWAPAQLNYASQDFKNIKNKDFKFSTYNRF